MWSQVNPRQALLESHLCNIFPNHSTLKNARKEVSIKNPVTGSYLEVDVWLPDINLCFEFQDESHYKPTTYTHISSRFAQQKDTAKRDLLLNRGLTLVVVPFWWNGKPDSLRGTIHFQRPDLELRSNISEIATNPPSVFDHTQLMLASFPDTNLVERNSWWVGEKWDGIRCYWHAAEKQLYSRQNVEIDIHEAFDKFGNLVLDGELWCGRGFFRESQLAITSGETLSHHLVRLVCFDEASLDMQSKSFETRYKLILSHLPCDHPTAVVSPRFYCTNGQELLVTLQRIIEDGGEGLILRKPTSRYLPGKSDSLYKIKAAYSDQEALVLKVEDDGALFLQLANGTTFSVARNACVLHRHPVKGDIVTLSFDSAVRRTQDAMSVFSKNYTTDGALSPVVNRIRSDLSWEDVIHKSADEPPSKLGNDSANMYQSITTSSPEKRLQGLLRYPQVWKHFDPPPSSKETTVANPVHSWKLLSDRREFFDKFAMTKGMDSRNPLFWYSVKKQDLLDYNRSIISLLDHYRRRLHSALMQIYPDIGLQRSLFRVKTNKFSWKTEDERRAYFENFATAMGMDARNPEFWYSVTIRDLMRFQSGYHGVAGYHGGTFAETLAQLYPDIGLVPSRFRARSPWLYTNARRKYFDKFAASQGADPRDPEFWYSVSKKEMIAFHPGLRDILQYYDGTLYDALSQLYPGIGLSKSLFKRLSRKTESGQRAYFDNYAHAQGMDPLNPRFWYGVTARQLWKFHRSYRNVTKIYGGKLSSTLMHLYPNIGLKKSLFRDRRVVKPNIEDLNS